jgi:hypothetical protein
MQGWAWPVYGPASWKGCALMWAGAGTLWDSNFYEMMVNNVMIAWATARSQSLLQPDRSNPCDLAYRLHG